MPTSYKTLFADYQAEIASAKKEYRDTCKAIGVKPRFNQNKAEKADKVN